MLNKVFSAICRLCGRGHTIYKLRKCFVWGLIAQNFPGECIHPICDFINLFIRIFMDGLPFLDKSSNQTIRSEEHTSELQSRFDLVCRLLLEKKKTKLCRKHIMAQ